MHRYVEQLVDCDEGLTVAEALPLAVQAASNGNGVHPATNGNGNGAAHAITNGNGNGAAHPANGNARGWQPGRSDGSRS